MIGVRLFAIEIEPQKKRTLHAMARRLCVPKTLSVLIGGESRNVSAQ
jgi:hypothetical protein